MLKSIVVFEGLWDALTYAPFALAILGGMLLGIGLFTARGWQPTCRRCRHDLREESGDRCPECGSDLKASNAVRSGRRQVRWVPLAASLVVLALGASPYLGLSTHEVRQWLAERLDPRDVYRLATSGNKFAASLHSQRMKQFDDAYVRMFIDETIRHFRDDPLSRSDPMAGDVQRLHAAPKGQSPYLTQLDEIITTLIKRADASEADAKAAVHLLSTLAPRNDPKLQAQFLSSDALLAACIELQVQPRIRRGSPLSARPAWTGMILLNERLEPRVQSVRWRKPGSETWSESVVISSEDDLLPGLEEDGEFEIELGLELNIPRNLIAAGSKERTVRVARTVRVEVIGAESLKATAAHGEEARAKLDPMLRTIRLRKFASTLQPKFGFPRLVGAAGRGKDEPLHFGGQYTVVYDGASYGVGRYFYSSQGSGGGGGGVDPSQQLDALALDTTKRIVLRIEPDVAGMRERLNDDFTYLDEAIELEFEGLDQPPIEVRFLPR
jgi:hypothetical protein